MSEMTPDAGGEALSVDAAIGLLAPVEQEQEQQAQEAPVEAADEPDEAEAETPAEDPAEDAETVEDEGEAEEEAEAVEPVEPPKYWAKDAKDAFAKLPPELQAVVLAQEGPREEAAAKAKQEAAEVRQRADAELQQVTQVVEKLNQFLPDAFERFKSKWEDVDWARYAEENPEAAFRDKLAMEQEQANLTKLAEARQQAHVLAHQTFLQAEAQKLVGTPLEKPEDRKQVGEYLLQAGITPDALNLVSAAELTIAHKAMMWDRAEALRKAKPPVVKPAAPAKPAPKVSAAVPQNSATRTASTAANRFAQTKSQDDAVALLLAMENRK